VDPPGPPGTSRRLGPKHGIRHPDESTSTAGGSAEGGLDRSVVFAQRPATRCALVVLAAGFVALGDSTRAEDRPAVAQADQLVTVDRGVDEIPVEVRAAAGDGTRCAVAPAPHHGLLAGDLDRGRAPRRGFDGEAVDDRLPHRTAPYRLP